METRTALNQRIAAWLERHHCSPRKLSLDAGCGEGMVRRILESENYHPQRETWEKLARTLGWDETEVLVMAGFAPTLPPSSDPLTVIRRELRRLGLSDGEVAAVLTLIQSISQDRLKPEVAPN